MNIIDRRNSGFSRGFSRNNSNRAEDVMKKIFTSRTCDHKHCTEMAFLPNERANVQ